MFTDENVFTLQASDFNKFLEDHGIDLLTSEADGTGLRGLYDLTYKGQEILGEFLGGATFTQSGWNNYQGKSAMIAWDLVRPLVIYILMRDGATDIVSVRYSLKDRGYYANYIRAYTDVPSERVLADLEKINKICPEGVRRYWRSGTAKDGLRNQHMFSGRIE
jgi:hypothetical protein